MSITWECEPSVRALIMRLSLRHRMEVVEILNMAREQELAEIDPIDADGEPYEWPQPAKGEPGWMSLNWITPSVPKPDAKIDLLRAQETAKADAGTCKSLLNHDPSIPTLLRVYRNQTDWFRFWSVRDPKPERRALNAAWAERCEAKMKQFEARFAAIKLKQRKEAN
jgi:hypothetical protein